MAKVLLTGATGFVGKRLLYALDRRGHEVRCMSRSARSLSLAAPLSREPELVQGDLLRPETLAPALEGVDAAYYLVHSMGGRSLGSIREFEEKDRRAAENFTAAAERAGVPRIIYLGGLGDMQDDLSPHLKSRQEVGRILSSGRARTTVFRAAVIIGAGGASFEIIRYLVERLPVMACPRWVRTKSQPISVDNVTEYLARCLDVPETAGRSLDIGGPEILSYQDLMLLYARVRGLRRVMFGVPVFTPRLSSYWVNLITPVPAGVVMPLAEGLRNEAVCREHAARDLMPQDLVPMETAICNALAETREGPGRLLSRQSCFLREGR